MPAWGGEVEILRYFLVAEIGTQHPVRLREEHAQQIYFNDAMSITKR